MKKITPFIWLGKTAEDAARFYCSVFKDSKILGISRYPEGGPEPAGKVMTVRFRLRGQEFITLNANPPEKLTHAVSFFVDCSTQREVDYYWRKLSSGGKEIQCGWLQDKFGVSWQIVPTVLLKRLGGKDRRGAARAMKAMMGMVKLDIKALEKACRGR
jgi:predicted 3-demethylubiquinone-9 3-methyltransferase (glyoxalase superfamily)